MHSAKLHNLLKFICDHAVIYFMLLKKKEKQIMLMVLLSWKKLTLNHERLQENETKAYAE